MKIISSYGVELRKQNIPIRQTLEIYRSAVRYLVEVYESVWEELAQIEESKKRFNAAEHLVHTTKRNPARFDFDFCFPRMPSYFRRAAVQHALGSVSSYRTRLEQWKAEGQKTGKPYILAIFISDLFNGEILLRNLNLSGAHEVSGIAHDVGVLIYQEYIAQLNAGVYVGVVGAVPLRLG